MTNRAALLDRLLTIDAMFHDVIDDLRDDEWDVRVEPDANTLAFDLWHVARCRDWTMHTLLLGVPELVTYDEWATVASPFHVTDGFGFTREEADEQGRRVSRADVLTYAGAGQDAIVTWLSSAPDEELDEMVVLHDRLAAVWPTDKTQELVDFAPGLFDAPKPRAAVLNGIAVGHNHGHLTELLRFKDILRAR